jgi:apyrase
MLMSYALHPQADRLCRAQQAGIIPDPDAKQFSSTPAAFTRAARQACALPAAAVTQNFPAASTDDAPFLCLDLSFQGTMLTEGLKIPTTQQVDLVKQVKYNGEYYEAAWPLGAAINTLSSM